MEEILSSIRKIISDDGPPQDTPASAPEDETVAFDTKANDDAGLDDLAFEDDDAFENAMPEDEAGILEALTAEPETAFTEDMFDSEPTTFETSDEPFDELPPLDDLSSFELDEPTDDGIVETAVFEVSEPVTDVEEDFASVKDEAPAEPMFAESPVMETETPIKEEPKPMPTSTLTDDKTAAAAAGALSKLVSKVDVEEDTGDTTTIEGLVRQMLRPMLKEWLDENLADIVDKHVEAEVKRIASRAG